MAAARSDATRAVRGYYDRGVHDIVFAEIGQRAVQSVLLYKGLYFVITASDFVFENG